jgi:hypothetical protein
MKRDMELIRKILIKVEESDRDPLDYVPLEIEGYDQSTVSYHIWLLVDAGLVEGVDCTSDAIFRWHAQRLTWDGHDFLQSIRDDTIWNKVKEKVLKPAASWTFTVLVAWLNKEIMENFGIK